MKNITHFLFKSAKEHILSNLGPYLFFLFATLLASLSLESEPWNRNEPSTLNSLKYSYKTFFSVSNISQFSDYGYFYVLILKGVNYFFDDSKFSLRFVSVLSYGISLAMLYKICLLRGSFFAFSATLIFALNTTVFMFAQHLRCYSLNITLTVFGMYSFINWLRFRQSKHLITLLVTLLLNVFVNFVSVLSLLAFFFFSLFRAGTIPQKQKKIILSSLALATPLIALKGVAIVKYRFIIRRSSPPSELRWQESLNQIQRLFADSTIFQFFSPLLGYNSLLIILSLFFALGVFNIYKSTTQGKIYSLFAVLTIVLPYLVILMLITLGLDEIQGRYFIFVTPIVSIIIAFGLTIFKRKIFQILFLALISLPEAITILNYIYNPLYVNLTLPLDYMRVKSLNRQASLCPEHGYHFFYLKAVWHNERKTAFPFEYCTGNKNNVQQWKFKLEDISLDRYKNLHPFETQTIEIDQAGPGTLSKTFLSRRNLVTITSP